jgi:hypothetical protein
MNLGCERSQRRAWNRRRWSRAVACVAFLSLPVARAQQGHEHHDGMMMGPMTASTTPLDLDMSRIGSGTAWQPDDTPMLGVHFQPGAGWDLMLHWNLVAGFDAQTTPRGGHQWTSMNW